MRHSLHYLPVSAFILTRYDICPVKPHVAREIRSQHIVCLVFPICLVSQQLQQNVQAVRRPS